MNTTQYTATSTATKMAFAALSLITVASFATAMKTAEQGAVLAAKASQIQTLEVRTAEPIIVVAKRDIRRLDAIEVVGRRSEVLLASAGGLPSSKAMFTTIAAR